MDEQELAVVYEDIRDLWRLLPGETITPSGSVGWYPVTDEDFAEMRKAGWLPIIGNEDAS